MKSYDAIIFSEKSNKIDIKRERVTPYIRKNPNIPGSKPYLFHSPQISRVFVCLCIYAFCLFIKHLGIASFSLTN